MPTAYVVHALPGRVRLKIPAKRGDAGYFQELKSMISLFPGIEVAAVNAMTGSILILYPPDLDILTLADGAAGFDVVFGAPPGASVAERLNTWIERGDQVLRRGSHGQIDAKSMSLLALLGFALHQVMRGDILQPALPILVSALAVLKGSVPKR